MQLAYAMLADVAQSTPDGKISIIGGDIDTINATAFPTVLGNLAIIIRLNMDLAECDSKHTLRVTILGPLGNTIGPPFSNDFTPQVPPKYQENQVRAIFVINIQGMMFETEGRHRFAINVDGKKLGEISILLARSSSQK
jgi:hypothetical protein